MNYYKMVTKVALVLLLCSIVYSQPPANSLGVFNWKAAVKSNVLIVDFDSVADKDDATRLSIATYRYQNIIITSSNSGNPGYFLAHRNIGTENIRVRLSYQILPKNLAAGQDGDSVNINVAQPIATRLLLEQTPSTQYIASLSNVDPSKQSLSPHIIFPHRILGTFTDSNSGQKTLDFSTSYSTISAKYLLNTLFVFHLFAIVYWFVTIYLIFINPFFDYARKSVRIFWVGHYALYFQFISLIAYVTTHLYYEPDYIFYMLDCAQLRFFGYDYTLFSTFDDRKNRIGYYVGKFSNFYSRPVATDPVSVSSTVEDPYLLCRQFPQFIIYLLAIILSAATSKEIKEMFVSMRLGCTVCFGVQLSFRGTLSVFQYFAGTTSGFLDILNLVLGFIFALLPLIDVILMKGQASKLTESSNFWNVPKSKGALYFDILGYTGHKKYRDYYPFPVGEPDVAFLSAILMCIFSFHSFTQSIMMIIMSILLLASVGVQNQFTPIKFIKLGFNFFIFLLYVFVFIVDLSQMVSVGTAKFLGTCMVIGVWLLLVLNLLILLYRLFELMGNSSSTYGENAKTIPPQKLKAANTKAKDTSKI